MTTAFSFPFSSPFDGSGFTFSPELRLRALGIQPPSLLGGLDRFVDPFTGDYMRTENGEWVETNDSRTIFLIAISTHLGRSPFDPSHGTSIHQRIKSGANPGADFLQAETVRVGSDLEAEGIISELQVRVRDGDGKKIRDSAGRQAVKTEWRDLASGSPVNATISPR